MTRPSSVSQGQVQPVELRIALFEAGHDPQGLGVVIEPLVGRHAYVHHVLAFVTEGRMSQIVGKGKAFGEILVETQGARQRPGDLRHLDRMGQPCAEMIALMIDEDLGLVLQAAKSGRMNDPVAIALKRRSRRTGRLGIETAPRVSLGSCANRASGCAPYPSFPWAVISELSYHCVVIVSIPSVMIAPGTLTRCLQDHTYLS